MKFCNRVVHSLPWEHNVLEKSWSKLELLERQLSYIKKTIQPYFSSKQYNTSNNNNKVTREKLVQLWFGERKKAINIINNKGVWPESVHATIDKRKTKEYYENKYSQHRSNLKQIVNDFQGGDDNIPDFTPEEQEISLEVCHVEKSGVMMGFVLKILRKIYVTLQWKFQIS